MSGRKHKKTLDVGKEARRRAREGIGLPPKEKIIPDKRRKPPRHKKQLWEDTPDER